MKFISLSLILVFLVGIAGRCNAMDADSTAMFHGAQKAFAACTGLQGVNIVDDGHVVCLRGHIDPTMFVSLLKLKDKIKKKPYVIVSGPGGYIDSSVYIVQMLDGYDPVPVVGDMCASGCAQFLILMGRHRVFLHCADVAMHSGYSTVQAVLAQNYSDEVTQRSVAMISQFKEFYHERHISMDMVTKPPADIQKRLNAGEVVFWPWSINKLRSFGVEGIVSENGPDDVVPSDYAKSCLADNG
jgi:ATP-dependent protease ClpP protease subunit